MAKGLLMTIDDKFIGVWLILYCFHHAFLRSNWILKLKEYAVFELSSNFDHIFNTFANSKPVCASKQEVSRCEITLREN